MNQDEFHEYAEKEAIRLRDEFSKLTEKQLLKIISRRFDFKYGIWRLDATVSALKALVEGKGTEKSIMPLFKVSCDFSRDFLIRHHTCEALFSIAGIVDAELKERVKYGRNRKKEKVNQEKAIYDLGVILGLSREKIKIKKKWEWWKFWR